MNRELNKQVDISHYQFEKYVSKPRFCSIWHQLEQAISLKPNSVLEIGQGLGIFKIMGNVFGLNIETIDIDPDLKPDYVGSVMQMPFDDCKYDLVCAFQVLEHLPYEDAIKAFGEILRVSKGNVLISLPDAKEVWRYCIYFPFLGEKYFFIPRFRLRALEHKFDGQHFWEINKKGFELKKIIKDLTREASLVKTFRVVENSYHRFFLFEKK